MPRKQKSEYLKELEVSLSIVQRELSAIGQFEHVWQSLSVQLSKILCDGNPTLIKRVIEKPTFHPTRKPVLKSQLPPTRPACIFHAAWRITVGNGSMTIECFDGSARPVDLETWLDFVFIEVEGVPLSIRDFIRIPRDKEAAHSHEKLYKKLSLAKGGYFVGSGTTQIASLPLGLGIIGSYVISRVKFLLNNEP